MCGAVLVVCKQFLGHRVHEPIWDRWYDNPVRHLMTCRLMIVALDGILFLSTVVVLKDRAQKERYRLIDDKTGLRI